MRQAWPRKHPVGRGGRRDGKNLGEFAYGAT